MINNKLKNNSIIKKGLLVILLFIIGTMAQAQVISLKNAYELMKSENGNLKASSFEVLSLAIVASLFLSHSIRELYSCPVFFNNS